VGTACTIFPYGVGYGANLGMIALAHFAHGITPQPPRRGVLKAIALGYLALATPYFIVWRDSPILASLALASLILVGLSVTAFSLWQSKSRAGGTTGNRWVRQLVISSLTSALAFCLRTFLF
jgi:thiol:disulfide interchange protein